MQIHYDSFLISRLTHRPFSLLVRPVTIARSDFSGQFPHTGYCEKLTDPLQALLIRHRFEWWRCELNVARMNAKEAVYRSKIWREWRESMPANFYLASASGECSATSPPLHHYYFTTTSPLPPRHYYSTTTNCGCPPRFKMRTVETKRTISEGECPEGSEAGQNLPIQASAANRFCVIRPLHSLHPVWKALRTCR